MKKYTQEQFVNEMEEKYKILRQEHFESLMDFKEKDLRGIDFRNINANFMDFQGSDLRGANFEECVFSAVNFSKADLRGTNFRLASAYVSDEDDVIFEDADLRGSCFDGASFEGVNFSGANFSGAEAEAPGACFNKANFRAANFNGASFSSCEFQGADFSYADFTGANLYVCDFKDALLRDTIFDETDISRSNFELARLHDYNDDDFGIYTYRIHRGLKGVESAEKSDFFHVPMSCPSHGSFIGWYGTGITTENGDEIFGCLKLEIPDDARRSSAEDEKCRCDKAKLLKILDIFGHDIGVSQITVSNGTGTYDFTVGQITEVKEFEKNRFKEGIGIPFYIDYDIMMTKCCQIW